jgi:hypothetical protein
VTQIQIDEPWARRERVSVPKGSCVCGVVEFEFRPPYRFFQYCHCTRCRRRSGSIHAANVAVPVAQLAWLRGERNVRRYELPTAERWCNAFCEICGSALPWKTRNGLGYVVPVGGVDGDLQEAPTRNVHVASRASWHVDAASLPSFDAEPAPTRT